MLINILRMPPVYGIPTEKPLDRHVVIHSGFNPVHTASNHLHWPHLPYRGQAIHAGVELIRQPGQLYKAIYTSQDARYVYECVFSVENTGTGFHNNRIYVCLYVKIVSPFETQIGVSFAGLQYYRNHNQHSVLPITSFLDLSANLSLSASSSLTRTAPREDIVPVVLNQRHLLQYLDAVIGGSRSGFVSSPTAWMYKPLFKDEPLLFEALLTGVFHYSPFRDMINNPLGLEFPQNEWSKMDDLDHEIAVMYSSMVVNHPCFDSQVLDLVLMIPTDFSVTASIKHAIDGLTDLWLFKKINDPFSPLVGKPFDQSVVKQLSTILHDCVMTYCQHRDTDFTEYMYANNKASITISKNIYDELVISFSEPEHLKRVNYYYSFPVLALSTMAVGWSQ